MHPDQFSARQKQFIGAAYIVSGGREVDLTAVAAKLGMSDEEALDLAIVLANKGVFTALGYKSTTVLFEFEGKDFARDLIDEGHGEGLQK